MNITSALQVRDSFLEQKLIEADLLQPDQLADAVLRANQNRMSLVDYLIAEGFVSKNRAYDAIAEIYGVPYVDIPSFHIPPEVLSSIPRELAYQYKVFPLFKIGNVLDVAMSNPADVTAIDNLSRKSRCPIEVCLGAPDDIDQALFEHYGPSHSLSPFLESLNNGKKPVVRIDRRPVIELVELMIKQAYEEGASDIHVEPEESSLRIRYRIDGVLHEQPAPPKEMQSEILSRIKILSQMNIAETRLPQDGGLKMSVNGKEIHMRVSTIPTLYGENIVIRLLRDEQAVLDVSSLGLSDEMRKVFSGLIARPVGMILVTGPTGSGKTTTLYAALRMINSMQRNIVTIEDPVEYKLPLLRQIPVNLKSGLTFANALRSMLRQDPDIIMVGEIRDLETAELAIQAGLTGHLVFSTLHTNDASSAITRLVDMKIEPYLISSSLIGVVSQRLVRRICLKCREEVRPSTRILELLRTPHARLRTFRGRGCRRCYQTGYKGRIGVFEILKVNETIQKKISANGSSAEIKEEARKSGFKDIREDALEKVEAGLTTAEEVLRVVVLD